MPSPLSRRSFLGATTLVATGIATGNKSAIASLSRARLPDPAASLVTRWDTDRWSRGAYSALPVGATAGIRQTLARAIIGNRLVFAGEYTDPEDPATVQGALRSGQRAARALIANGFGPKVVVIGAGMAGVSAAHDLAISGAQVVVVEARDRIGGRVQTNTSWGLPVEMGAAWVHALKANPLVPLAQQARLKLIPSDYENESFRDTKTGRPSPSARRASILLGRLLSQLENSWPNPSTSVASWLQQHGLPANRFSTWAVETGIVQEYGLNASRLGARAPTEGGDYLGGDAFVAGGYQHIPQLLAADLEIQLNSPVVNVDVSQARNAYVTVESGEVLTADAVVVAVPVTLLQAQAPGIAGLPADIQSALGKIATGDLEKVILRYDEQWWGAERVLGIVGGGVPGQSIQTTLNSALRWTEFFDVTDVVGAPALVGFSGGSAARTRPKSDSACVAEAMAMLQAAFH